VASEIVFLITEQRNKQRITLPAGSYRFGRSAQCEYVQGRLDRDRFLHRVRDLV